MKRELRQILNDVIAGKFKVSRLLFVVIFAGLQLTLQTSVLGQEKGDKVYDAVQIPAEPKGGMRVFEEYVGNNLTYPTLSLRNKTQGTVEIGFIIEKNGTVSNVEIIKGLDDACDKEALRVVRNSPHWIPAKHKGQVVRQRVTMPIIFTIPSQLANGNPTSDSTQNNTIKQVAPEEAARPEGGQDAFFAYLKANQKYPAKAKKNKIEGKVMVEFVVEKDGSLTNLKVIKKLGNGLDEEAIRLIEKGPKWLPAKFKGEPIRQKMILPVIFQL